MDRADALAWLNSAGLGSVMASGGRDIDDSLTGYSPALDRAFSMYIAVNELATNVGNTDIPLADEYGFTALLSAVTYDLVLPAFALKADASVDAPLSNVKRSQMYRHLKELRDDAWSLASDYGYVNTSNVGGWSVNLDFKEPPNSNSGGFG